MTSRRLTLQFPLRGLSDDTALSEQQPLTTSDARNVRGIDPVSGRSRGGQRAGSEKFNTTALGGSLVQDIAVVTRDSPKVDYANLATGNLTVEWSSVTPQEGTTWWPEPDFQGNIVLLDGNNQLAKYNADGVLLRKTPLLSGGSGTVVKKLAVDVDGGVYAASYAADYSSGTLWRFVDSETDIGGFEESWRIDFSGEAPVMFTMTGNTLYVVVRPSTGLVGYYLRRYDGPLTGVPALGTQVECPGPVNALEVGATGAVWLVAGENAQRGAGPETNGVSRVSRESDLWTPYDLTNADQRVYFHTRSDNIDGSLNTTLTDGDEVADWEDHRLTGDTGVTVYDTTDRKWFKDAGSPARPGPTYRATGWGGQYPCVQYDGNDTTAGANTLPGQALQTENNQSANKKASDTAALSDQFALQPGMDDAEYFTCLLVKITPTSSDDGPAALVSQWAEGTGGPSPGALSLGILANAEWDSGSLAYSADSVAMECETNSAGAGMSGGNADGATDQAREGAFDSDGYALITVVHHGISASSSAFRVNGRWTDSFLFLGDMNYGDPANIGGRTIMGCRRAAQSQSTQSDYWRDGDGWVSFTGEVVECITVLADSSVGTNSGNTHDLRISHPHGDGTPYGYSASSEGALAGQRSARYAVVASEVELVEGYMAHYWGVSHILPREYKDAAQSGAYPSNHPFAGPGNYPRKSGSTIDPLTVDAWSPDPVVWRCAAASLEVIQAVAGGGIGYAIAAAEDGSVATVGPKSGRTGSGTHYGPDNLADETVIARKYRDSLTGIRQNSASWGFVYCVSPYNYVSSGGGVQDGDEIEISDGTTSVTFEFDDDSSFTETQVDINGLTLASLQMAELVTVINASALNLTARQNGPLIVELFHDSTGANNVTITTTAPSRIGVVGMTGGETASSAWTLSNGGDAPDTAGLRMAFDDEGDLWVPQLLAGDDETVTKLDGTDGSTLVEYDLDSTQEATGVALPLSHPSYIGSPSVTGPLFMWVTSTGGALPVQQDNFRSVRLVSETQDLSGALTPRATRFLGVVGGVVKEFDNGSTVTTKSGGSLVSDSPYISSVVIYNKVVWTDGETYLTYDAQTDVLEPLISRKGGTLPKNGRVLANWNGRLLIARTADEPYNIYGSRRGDITDWNEFPAVPDYLEAFSTPNSIAGRCPDIVNALMPLDDDLLVVGGDHSIFRLTGDPTAGGAFDLVSDITGAAFGQGWCKDPGGALYFFGSRGGVYRMAGGSVERLTRDRIERRMADLDLSSYRLRLVYCHEAEEIQVIPVPYAVKSVMSTPPVRWALDKNGAWWEDSSATWDVAPTAVAVADGDDPDDRVLLYGCEDGYVRKWSQNAKSDDGERIASHVRIGPIAPTQSGREFRFMSPQIVLASDQGGATVEFYATDDPQTLGEAVGSAVLGPGMNPRLPIRARGAYLYAVIRNAELSGRWAYEQGTVSVAPAGRQRVR